MIELSATFDYRAPVTRESFSNPAVIVMSGEERVPRAHGSLLGPRPEVRLANSHITLFAEAPRIRDVKQCQLYIGDLLECVVRPGDEFFAVHTSSDQYGFSILRNGELVAALGAIASVQLGEVDVSFIGDFDVGDEVEVHVHVGRRSVTLEKRTAVRLGDFEIYCERPHLVGTPGIDECISVVRTSDPSLRDRALRSAVILAHSGAFVRAWDGRGASYGHVE